LWSQQLELYLGIHTYKLRFFTPDGQLIPTPEEAEQQQRELAQQQVTELESLLVRYRERFGELPG
jgi:hypothetical protein